MFAKLAVLILAVGVFACSLLALRQQRLDAVHELAVSQKRMAERDRDLFQLRTRIASRVMPDRVEALAAKIGPLEPIRVDGPTRPGTPNPTAITIADPPRGTPARTAATNAPAKPKKTTTTARATRTGH